MRPICYHHSPDGYCTGADCSMFRDTGGNCPASSAYEKYPDRTIDTPGGAIVVHGYNAESHRAAISVLQSGHHAVLYVVTLPDLRRCNLYSIVSASVFDKIIDENRAAVLAVIQKLRDAV